MLAKTSMLFGLNSTQRAVNRALSCKSPSKPTNSQTHPHIHPCRGSNA